MRNEYIENKRPKLPKIYQLITKTITLDRKNSGLEFDDIANEIGLNGGTLRNKLKPSDMIHDMSIMEYIHLLELTGNYESLEYIASHFDMVLLHKSIPMCSKKTIRDLVDDAILEESDILRVTKIALQNNDISENDKNNILKELDEADRANAAIRVAIKSINNEK